MDFKGKNALVTGAGAIGGLGYAVARILASGGADVTVTGRDPRRGAQVVENLGGRLRFLSADLSKVDTCGGSPTRSAPSIFLSTTPRSCSARPRRRWSP
ncbi:SDR family NAD(P)-dependent oxidoreductase [Streptomyces iranensis]|uniref:SDR family NAD(P)-dependent oxidoreductase n=1 Tax=Streptomyces iranensis TaxID=576784 RepID=UPI0027E316E4|nr:SDR family NAD(P)-dependent oxidoreductase [Streptomyces iranensis]